MVRTSRSLAMAAGIAAALTQVALAGPWRPGMHAKPAHPTSARPSGNSGGGMDGPGWNDNFDSYASGSQLIGQGGWEGWPGYVNNNPTAFASTAHATSTPNSARLAMGDPTATPPTDQSDFVHQYNVTGGHWIYRAMTYFSSTATHTTSPGGDPYFILLRAYDPVNQSNDHWAVQVHFIDSTGTAPNQNVVMNDNWMGGGTTYAGNVFSPQPLVMDQWVEIRADIDLDDANSGHVIVYYNNAVVSDTRWHDQPTTNPVGPYTLQAVDLYDAGISEFYYDDISLAQVVACYPNCDHSTTAPCLNVADFTCFLNAFAAGATYANCDNSTTPPVLNVADFTCFLNTFATGCGTNC